MIIEIYATLTYNNGNLCWNLMFLVYKCFLQMSSGGEANKEFKEQLRMQELYAQRNADDSDPYTYTDPEDGTVYDWDRDKKAWFPKVGLFFF